MFGKYSIRKILNRSVSARVNAQMDWRMRELQTAMESFHKQQASEVARLSEIIEAMQRSVTELSIAVTDRLLTLEAAAQSKAED